MNQLYISLYLDEDVDVRLKELLWAYGFEAQTTRDAGNLEARDEKQLAYATTS